MSQDPSFTGRKRRKQTPWAVRYGDAFARAFITIGGIGTIVAVCLVFVFLGLSVLPLFRSAHVSDVETPPIPWQTADSPSPAPAGERPLRVVIDEYQTMGWALYADGKLQVFRLDTGETLEEKKLFEDASITALSLTVGQDDLGLGFADGSVRIGNIRFKTTFQEKRDVPQELQNLETNEAAVLGKGVVLRTPQGQFRSQTVAAEFLQPVKISDVAVERLDHAAPEKDEAGAKEHRFAAYSADQKAWHCKFELQDDLFGGPPQIQKTVIEMPAAEAPKAPIKQVLLTEQGDNVHVIWEDGTLVRYNIRDLQNIRIVEKLDLLPEDDVRLTACNFLLGQESVVCGDSQGRMRVWFRTRRVDEARKAE